MKYTFLIVLLIAAVVLVGCAKQETQTSPEKVTATNTASQPTASKVAAGGIDIAVLNLTTSSPSFKAGDRVTLYPVIKNLGPPISNVEVGIYAGSTLVKMLTFNFKQSETKSPPFSWYPEKSGDYIIKVLVDPNDKIGDSNPENDQMEKLISIS
jgi:hypothetical protein